MPLLATEVERSPWRAAPPPVLLWIRTHAGTHAPRLPHVVHWGMCTGHWPLWIVRTVENPETHSEEYVQL